ncbi:MAG TPA: hypothetical protein VI172_14420 [Candidatus Dormibacteraeota bacterium]
MIALLWLRWALQRAGYVVRPYDMLADRRRWFWQPQQRCGWNWQHTPDGGWYSGPGRPGQEHTDTETSPAEAPQ